MALSAALGEQRELRLPQGTIRYRERGTGDPLVFVHGILSNGDLWRQVVPRLAEHHRCITPDWPLGSHHPPLARRADLSPPGLAELIARFLEELDLREVTLVANDTGGGLAQILVTTHPERIARLVLTSCDAFTNFPPHVTKPLRVTGFLPGTIKLLSPLFRLRRGRRLAYLLVSKRDFPEEVWRSYLEPGLTVRGVRRDLGKVLRGLRAHHTMAAARRLHLFDRPVLVAWAREDKFFPLAHGRRLSELFPNARLVEVPDSYTFVPEDQPDLLAREIERFVGQSTRHAEPLSA